MFWTQNPSGDNDTVNISSSNKLCSKIKGRLLFGVSTLHKIINCLYNSNDNSVKVKVCVFFVCKLNTIINLIKIIMILQKKDRFRAFVKASRFMSLSLLTSRGSANREYCLESS